MSQGTRADPQSCRRCLQIPDDCRLDHACDAMGIQGFGTFWLDDFYDRNIPNTTDLQHIRHYIRKNPPALATREG